MDSKFDTRNFINRIRRASLVSHLGLGALLLALVTLSCYALVSPPAASPSNEARGATHEETASDNAMGANFVGAATQEDFTGLWTIDSRNRRGDNDDNKVYLSIQRRTSRGGNSQSSSGVPFETFRGLTREQMMSSTGNVVRFQIVRDAGTLNCEGWFKDGRGAGQFTFVVNQSYVGEMSRLGYSNLSEEKLFALAVHDVSTNFIQELKGLGYDRLSLDDLLAFRIHGVSPKFIQDFRARGYDRLPSDDLVAMRIHGVTTEFVEELKAAGYPRQPIDQLVAMRIHGVTPEFTKELEALGYERVPIDDLVGMRIHGVTPEFIKDLRAAGYDRVSVEDLVAMRIHGVTIAFIERMKARGFKDLSVEDLVSMRIHGIGK